MRKLQAQEVAQVRRALKQYERWWKSCLRIFELNTQLTLAREA